MLEISNVSKTYQTAAGPLNVLSEVNLTLTPGSAISIMGPSGSGKSTLLHILGALDPPTSGTITFNGDNPFTLGERQQAAFRNRHIGFIFQEHALLPQCTVLENVLIPTLVSPDAQASKRAEELLERVGLSGRAGHTPAQLSGGEKQRAAIARALIRSPGLVLCDEPTGSLDAATAESVSELLLSLHGDTILVIVTHNPALAAKTPAAYELRHRRLVKMS